MRAIQFVWSFPNETSFNTLTPGADGDWNVVIKAFIPTSAPLQISGHKAAVLLDEIDFNTYEVGAFNGTSTTETEYLNGARVAIQAIRDTSLDKVVLSTTTFVPAQFETKALLQHLRDSHPRAFVYFLSHPELGCWLGATPEPLITGSEGKFQTVSLAGTRMHEQEVVPWGQKESLEQSIVTDYIRERLTSAGASEIRISRPETLKYGSIEHLCSTIRFESNDVAPVMNALHPTPAVCGSPLKDALPLIQNIENHNRSLYTGYIGLVSSKQEVSVFVNLRCMQLFTNGLLVYTGGGLTLESDPIDEWRETRNKMKALLNGFVPTHD